LALPGRWSRHRCSRFCGRSTGPAGDGNRAACNKYPSLLEMTLWLAASLCLRSGRRLSLKCSQSWEQHPTVCRWYYSVGNGAASYQRSKLFAFRITGIVSAVLFIITAARIFWARNYRRFQLRCRPTLIHSWSQHSSAGFGCYGDPRNWKAPRLEAHGGGWGCSLARRPKAGNPVLRLP
jgi:hypothetical protein